MTNLKNIEKAIEAYNKAIQTNPEFDAAWFNKACTYALMKEKDKMLSSLKRAIGLNPQYKMALQQAPDFKDYRNDPDFIKLTGR